MKNLHARKPLEGGMGQVIVPSHPQNRRLQIKTPESGIHGFDHRETNLPELYPLYDKTARLSMKAGNFRRASGDLLYPRKIAGNGTQYKTLQLPAGALDAARSPGSRETSLSNYTVPGRIVSAPILIFACLFIKPQNLQSVW
jgi:hypothetical protein